MRTLFLALCALLCVGVGGCYTHVDPGHVGILVDSCSGGGVQAKPLGVGYHGTGACTSIIEYPTFVQTAVWTKDPNEGHPANEEISFTNADQMQIHADISLSYQLDAAKAPAFYKQFKADDLDKFTHGFLRNLARDEFDKFGGKYSISQVMGDNAQFLKEVREALQSEVAPFGIQIVQFGFVGAPRPPQAVIDAINAKATATQKALQIELELKQSQAQAAKRVAEAEGEAKAIKLHADAEAYANQTVAKSLSSELVEYARIKKWDGKMPLYTGGGAGGTMINLK